MSNIDRLRDAYARYNRRDFGIVDDTFAEDIDWRIPGLAEVTGRDGVRAFFEGLAEQFASHTIAMSDSVESGDRLVAFVTHTFTRQDGATQDVLAVHSWTFDGDMITSLYEITDSAAFAVFTGQLVVPATA